MRKVEGKVKFNGGAISPFLKNRVDLQAKYNASVQLAENAIIMPEGPIRRRPGFAFIGTVDEFIDTGSNKNYDRIIPYRGRNGGDSLLFFHESGGQLYISYSSSEGAITSPATYDIVESTATLSGYASEDADEMQYTQIDDTIYIAHKDNPPQYITITEDASGDITGVTAGEFFPFPPPTQENGLSPATTVTPSATTGTGVTFTSGAAAFLAKDVGRQIVNLSSGETGRASITGYTSTTQVTCDIVEDFTDTNAIASGDWKMDLSPIVEINFTADTTVTGAITNVTTTGGAAAFRSADTGDYILVHNGVLQIVTVNSASDIDCEILKSMTSDAKTFNWTLEQEEWTATRGYPGAITVFQDRLIFGGTNAKPNTIWMSESQLYDGFGPGSDDGDSVVIDVLNQTGGRIRWMAGGRDLSVGTDSAELTVSSTSGVLTPSNTESKVRTYYGSEIDNPRIQQINNEILFIDRSGRALRSFYYDFNIDNYKAENITFFIPHLLNTGSIKDFCYVPSPIPSIFIVTSDGRLLNGTYLPDQEIIAWGEWTFGDYSFYSGVGQTDQQIEVKRIAAIQDTTGYTLVAEFSTSVDGGNSNNVIGAATFRASDIDVSTRTIDASRYWTDLGELTTLAVSNLTSITNANPPVVTWGGSASELEDGNYVQLGFKSTDTEWIAAFGERMRVQVQNISGSTFELKGVDASGLSANALSGGFVRPAPKTTQTASYTSFAAYSGIGFTWRIDGGFLPGEYSLDASYTSTISDQNDPSPYWAGTYMEFGMAYTTRIVTLPFAFEGNFGPTPFEDLRAARIYLQGYKLIPPTINGKITETRLTTDVFGATIEHLPALLNGYAEYGPFDWTPGSVLTIEYSYPNSGCILGLFTVMEGNLK